ncbi:MAG: hypothetical protein HUJ95_05070 [Bacteroidales bacterium]|nr:hypothetical protein [Bacteroidales bacterium]
MKKFLLAIGCCLLMAVSAFAQKPKQDNKPEVGKWSVGVSFNVLSIGKAVSQPADNTGVADFVSSNSAFVSEQMNIITKDPIAKINFKYLAKEHFALRIGVGVSGSKIDYREYVTDDLAKFNEPLSEKVVFDTVHGNLTTFSASLGGECRMGKQNVQFIIGFGLNYVIGGGRATLDYGNVLNVANPKPSTVGIADVNGALNTYKGTHLGISWARPVERYTQGHTQAISFCFDMGIEWFFIKNASLQASLGIVPVSVAFQPQSWAKYEGLSEISNKVETYVDLVSPGSTAILYGTNNLSLNFGLNYYFK